MEGCQVGRANTGADGSILRGADTSVLTGALMVSTTGLEGAGQTPDRAIGAKFSTTGVLSLGAIT